MKSSAEVAEESSLPLADWREIIYYTSVHAETAEH